MNATTIERGAVKWVRAIRDLRALDGYHYVDWKKPGDEFAVRFDGELSNAWIAAGPDGLGVSLWIGEDVEFA